MVTPKWRYFDVRAVAAAPTNHDTPVMTATNFTDLRVNVEIIDVQKASEYLNKNFKDNRTISKTHVNNLAAEMTDGAFGIGTDCIAFDEAGRLINGQHRLSAVIKSQTNQPFIVVRGLPKKVAQLIDGGKKRTMAQRITIGGVRMSEKECACIRNALNNYSLATTGVVEFKDKKWDDLVAGIYLEYQDFFNNLEISKKIMHNSFFAASALKMFAEMNYAIEAGASFKHGMSPTERVVHWLDLTEKGYSENCVTTPFDTAAISIRNMKNRQAVDSRGARWSRKVDYRNTLSAAYSFMMGFTVKHVKKYADDPFTSLLALANNTRANNY